MATPAVRSTWTGAGPLEESVCQALETVWAREPWASSFGLGAIPTADMALIPRAIAAFRQAHPAVVVEALAAARPGGRVLLFAANDPVTKIEFPAAAVGIDEKEILGSYSAAVDIQQAAAELVLHKKLQVIDIVTHCFTLDRIQEALELAARPTEESLKVLITHK